jgi:hypothetical protein
VRRTSVRKAWSRCHELQHEIEGANLRPIRLTPHCRSPAATLPRGRKTLQGTMHPGRWSTVVSRQHGHHVCASMYGRGRCHSLVDRNRGKSELQPAQCCQPQSRCVAFAAHNTVDQSRVDEIGSDLQIDAIRKRCLDSHTQLVGRVMKKFDEVCLEDKAGWRGLSRHDWTAESSLSRAPSIEGVLGPRQRLGASVADHKRGSG